VDFRFLRAKAVMRGPPFFPFEGLGHKIFCHRALAADHLVQIEDYALDLYDIDRFRGGRGRQPCLAISGLKLETAWFSIPEIMDARS
jgi:hypothetical protein